MFLHKLRRTFTAMFWGWMVCNLVTLLVSTIIELTPDFTNLAKLRQVLNEMFYWSCGTAIVIFITWLCVFLPADLLVPDTSEWRRPKTACRAGFVAGYAAFFIPLVLFPFIETGKLRVGADLIIMSLLAGVTGLTASLHITLKYPRQAKPTL